MNSDHEANTNICIVELSFIDGLFFDLLSFCIGGMFYSMLCVSLTLHSIYLEVFGVTLIDL